MARLSLTDHLQSHTFWLMDVAPIEPLSLPLFTPILGFESISAPEITTETQDIVECNWLYRRKVLKRAAASPITLSRGVSWFESDFYNWMVSAVRGNTDVRPLGGLFGAIPHFSRGGATYRRTLVLIQFFPHFGMGKAGLAFAGLGAVAAGGIAAAQQSAAGGLSTGTVLAGAGFAAGESAAAVAVGATIGPSMFALRVPARAFYLFGCIPTRYKSGSDFDAKSGDVSIAELEMEIDFFEEISLGSAL